MILAALLIAAAAPGPVADAERAFAADAAARGQWTAFRAAASQGGWMFAPGPVPAHRLLAGRADPPQPLRWWPVVTTTACDGSLALSQGKAVSPDGQYGAFNTIWHVEPDGRWRWLADWGSDSPAAANPGPVTARRASCRNLAGAARSEPAVPASLAALPRLDGGASRDGTIRWVLRGAGKAHLLLVWAWDGGRHREIARTVAP